jgi:hypothetical protein
MHNIGKYIMNVSLLCFGGGGGGLARGSLVLWPQKIWEIIIFYKF